MSSNPVATHQGSRFTLRLGLFKLPAAEVVLVRTLLRLSGQRDATTRWDLVEHPPYDALLIDPASAGSDPIPPAGTALRLVPINAVEQADAIQRPIRAARLFSLLDQQANAPASAPVAAAIRPSQAMGLFSPVTAAPAHVATEKVQAVAAPAQPARPEFNAVPVLVSTVEAVEAPKTTEPAADDNADVPLPAYVPDDTRYRLRRWPPTFILRRDPSRIRMATLLSKRAFNVAELAELSQQSPETCYTFVCALISTGLATAVAPVEPVRSAEIAPAGDAPPAAAVPVAQPEAKPRHKFAKSLLSGLRLRLGI